MATPHRTSFQLTGADGGPLRVDVRRQPKATGPAVIICHGFKGFKDWGFFPVLADRLARAGLIAVSFNFSGSGVAEGDRFGEPERFGRATFTGDLTDIGAVRDALRAGDLGPVPTRIGLFGHSRGGGMAVVFAAEQPVDALVTWNPIGKVLRWGPRMLEIWRQAGKMDIENARTGEVLPLYTDVLDDIAAHPERLDLARRAREVTAPWLNVVGSADVTVPPTEGQWGDVPATIIVEGGSHTFGAVHPWAGGNPQVDRAMDETVGFFVDALTR